MNPTKNLKLLVPVIAISVAAVERDSQASSRDQIGVLSQKPKEIPKNDPGASAWIDLKHVAQGKNLCVCACSEMVLDFYGDPTSQYEIKTISRGRRYDSNAKFRDFTITFFRDLVRGLTRKGYPWREINFDNNAQGLNRGLRAIEASLDRRRPVLVDTTLYRGHTMAVVGYDRTSETIYFHDPSIDEPGLRRLSYREFGEIWNSKGVGFNKRASVFTFRKR